MSVDTAVPIAPEVPPEPIPDLDTEGFWQATARGELALCRCQLDGCRLWHHPPLEKCRRCAAVTAFEPISGAGEVFSFIVVHRASVPGFSGELPYVVAVIELEEQPGLRVASRLVGVDPAFVTVGQRVRAEVADIAGSTFRIPVFRPAL